MDAIFDMTAKLFNMPGSLFARARARIEKLAEDHEMVEIDLAPSNDIEIEVDLTAHTAHRPLISMLSDCVNEFGTPGVYQELIK